MQNLTQKLATRSLERSLAGRKAVYVEEIQDIVDATYRVIQRTEGLDPTLRDILKESRLSTQAFYKHFRSKDELFLLLLDDGRRRLVGYLTHRMEKATTPAGRIRAWIEGVMAQAANTEAAARTRPFLANRDRLAEQFPTEQQASVDLLVDLLAGAMTTSGARRDAEAIYDVTFAALHRFLIRRKRPTPKDVDHLVRFCLNAVEARGKRNG